MSDQDIVSVNLRHDLLAIADAETGRFVHLNRHWEDVLGWSREELMASPLLEFVHPEDHQRTLNELDLGKVGDYEVVSFENRYRRKDGAWKWLRWTAHSDGASWVARAEDITELKDADELLQRALADGRMLAYTQPIYDSQSRRAVQEELLVRMLLADGSVALPAAFVPAAEESGMIRAIDRWMLSQALEVAAPQRPVEVNLSARSISDPAFVEEAIGLLEGEPERCRWLGFEITETALLDHLDAARDVSERLAGLGCHLLLDDFGTGFGSLTYLRHLPIHGLKIDASFVRGLAGSVDDQRLVRSIVALAGEFQIGTTIAEGVEDAETNDLLRELGVALGQGYHFGRPRPLL